MGTGIQCDARAGGSIGNSRVLTSVKREVRIRLSARGGSPYPDTRSIASTMNAAAEPLLMILAATVAGAALAAIGGLTVQAIRGPGPAAPHPAKDASAEEDLIPWEPWLAYIDDEVKEACEARGWRHQIHRQTGASATTGPQSPLDEFRWRLIPGADDQQPEALAEAPGDSVYYALRFDRKQAKFILQHDTHHKGMPSSSWRISTYSDIHLVGAFGKTPHDGEDAWLLDKEEDAGEPIPPSGWLRDCLLELTSRFQANEIA